MCPCKVVPAHSCPCERIQCGGLLADYLNSTGLTAAVLTAEANKVRLTNTLLHHVTAGACSTPTTDTAVASLNGQDLTINNADMTVVDAAGATDVAYNGAGALCNTADPPAASGVDLRVSISLDPSPNSDRSCAREASLSEICARALFQQTPRLSHVTCH